MNGLVECFPQVSAKLLHRIQLFPYLLLPTGLKPCWETLVNQGASYANQTVKKPMCIQKWIPDTYTQTFTWSQKEALCGKLMNDRSQFYSNCTNICSAPSMCQACVQS